jgi:AbrB family looped-hinge helix DNA binding protein
MAELTKLSSKGQVVVPKEIRDGLALKNGDWLAIAAIEDMVVIKKLSSDYETEMKKKLKKSKSEEFLRMEELLYPGKE